MQIHAKLHLLIIAVVLISCAARQSAAANATVLNYGELTWENVTASGTSDIVVATNVSQACYLIMVQASQFGQYISGVGSVPELYNNPVYGSTLTVIPKYAPGKYSVLLIATNDSTVVWFNTTAFPTGKGKAIQLQRSAYYNFTLSNYSIANITILSQYPIKANVSGISNAAFPKNALLASSYVTLDRGPEYVRFTSPIVAQTFVYVSNTPVPANPVGITNFSKPLAIGIASYGISNQSGRMLAYNISTNTVVGRAAIGSISAYAPKATANVPRSGASVQLNSVLDVSGVRRDYYYLLQNMMVFNTSSRQYYVTDMVWNLTQPFANITRVQLKGGGAIGVARYGSQFAGYRNVKYYSYSTTAANYSGALNFTPITSVTSGGGYAAVRFGYISQGNSTFYDSVNFSVQASARLTVNPYYRTPYSNYFDSELVFGSAGSNVTATYNNLTANLSLFYYTNGILKPMPSFYTFGADSPEAASNLSVTQNGNVEQVTTGQNNFAKLIQYSPGAPTTTSTSVTTTTVVTTSSPTSTTILSTTTIPEKIPLIGGISITNCKLYGTGSTVVQRTITSNGFSITSLVVTYPGLQKNITIDLTNLTFGQTFGSFATFMLLDRYYALFTLMLLEQSSLPIPSEVIATTAGYLSSKCVFSFTLAFLALTLGGIIGIAIDYYIGYYLGRGFIYSHLRLFRIKKEQLKNFEAWFKVHGSFAVFVTRLLPVIRTVMSFPAGFTHMSRPKFFGYSLLGLAMWNFSLMVFGYLLTGTGNTTAIAIAIAAVLIAFYAAYHHLIRRIRKIRSKRSGHK